MATDEPARIARIIARARRVGRSGSRRITALLRAAGWRVNPKRVERLWRQEGLRVPRNAPRRRRRWATDGSCTRRRAERPNRLFQGDATDAAALARCRGDTPADLVVTDPPDNVNHGACCVSHDARMRWASSQAVSCVPFRSRWIFMPDGPWRFLLSKGIAIAQVRKASGELLISVFEFTEQAFPPVRTPVLTAILDARASTGDGGMETALTLGETIGRLHRPMRWRLGTQAERPGLDRIAPAVGVTIAALVRQMAAEGRVTVVPMGERRVPPSPARSAGPAREGMGPMTATASARRGKGAAAASPTVEQLPIDDLHPDPGNPRRIEEAELAARTRSIATFGVVDPVLARRGDRRVIAGHQRLLATRRCGLPTVPVILLDLSAEDARLLNVALNRIGGEWDPDPTRHADRAVRRVRRHARRALPTRGSIGCCRW